MDSYVIICDDWRLLEEEPEAICRQFERYTESEARYFAPVLFAEYSCLTQFVDEEIDLVITSQHSSNAARLGYDQFVEFWGWRDMLSTKVYHLSGGWRKLLGLALFLNQKCDDLLVIDFTSHLSDRLIRFALLQAERLGIRRIGFAEYDEEIIQKYLTHFKKLRRSGQRLVDVD